MSGQMQYSPDCICRICLLESDEMIGIFNGQSNENIPNILMFFASIKISNGDGLPNQICSICMYEANNAYFFKQKCEESDKFLRDTLQQQNQLLHHHQQNQHQQQHPLEQQNVLYISHNETLDDSQMKNRTESSLLVTEMITTPDLHNDVFCDFFNNDESNSTNEINAIDPFKSLSSSNCLDFDNNTTALPLTSSLPHLDIVSSHLLPTTTTSNQSNQPDQLQLKHEDYGIMDNYNYFNKNNDDILVKTIEKSKKKIIDKLNKKKITKLNILSSSTGVSSRSFSSLGSLGINKLHCNECDEIFDKKIDLRRHLAVDHVFVDGEKTFECVECKKLYATDAILNIHMKTHNNKEYPCENCTKIFYRLDKLVEHKKRHSGERSHICPKCGKGFYNKYYLDRHMHIHERDHLERPIYECSVCGKKMAHSNHLQVHMRAHLDRAIISPLVNDGTDGGVDIDGLGDHSIFSSTLQMKLHDSVTATDNNPIKLTSLSSKQKKIILCSVCGKSCSSRSNLAVHMRRHTGKMTNFCKICGKGYPRTTDLTVHMRKHTGEKPFHCQICSRNFARSDKLAVHMRTHTGEKPYVCNCCGRAFAQSNDLASHKRRNVCQSSLQPPLTLSTEPPQPPQTQFNESDLSTTSTEINNIKSMYLIAHKTNNNIPVQTKLINLTK